MSNFLEGMQLPKSNEQEELEDLSKEKFRPLFDKKLFEIREETYKDKGIDLDIELKYKGNYTNFRFIIQLKATDSIEENVDGSYSKSIDTSNLQYLLNSGKQAYYVLYHNKTQGFYYSDVNSFFKKLFQENENWKTQKTNTLRFEKKLGLDSIQNIYDNVLERGKNLRKITDRIALSSKGDFEKISITNDTLKSYSENKIRDEIEMLGLNLINEGNSSLVAKAVNMVSKNLQQSHSKFNLVAAIANYNLGNMLDALSFLKESEKAKASLRIEDLSLLDYFISATKYSLGILSSKEYLTTINSIDESSFIQYYIKIELLGQKHSNSTTNYSLSKYKDSLYKLIEKEGVPHYIVNLAKSEYYKYWSLEHNARNFQNYLLLSKSIISPEIVEINRKLQEEVHNLESYFNEIKSKITRCAF